MKKIAMLVLAVVGLTLNVDTAKANWGTLHYGCQSSGHSTKGCWDFWNCGHCGSEEERWQRFWHDYYKALGCYYKRLDKIDWVIYYKYHGYPVGGCAPTSGCNYGGYGCQPPCQQQFAPVFVSPTMQLAPPHNPQTSQTSFRSPRDFFMSK